MINMIDMINAISLDHKQTLTAFGILAVILLIFCPKLLGGILRFSILIVVAGLLMMLRNLIDPLELFVSIVLSRSSAILEVFGGIESIALDSAILFVCARVILPKSYIYWIILVCGGALYCLSNLFTYDTFSFMPFGYDPDAEGGINWLFNIIYMAVYGLFAWMFMLKDPEEEVELSR